MNNHPFALAYAGLFLAAIVWGIAFVPQRIAMEHTGPFTFNAIRFGGGAVLVGLFLGTTRLRAIGRKEIIASLIVGGLLYLGAAFQQIGMVSTTAGKGGFITSLYIVLVPVLLCLVWKENIALSGWIGALIAVFGMGILSLSGDFSLSIGDVWVLICSLVFSFHVIAISKSGTNIDPLTLSVGQYIVCAVLSFISAAFLETNTWSTTHRAAIPFLYMIFFSIGIGYTLQVVSQKYVVPSAAAIILSLESVFALLAGWTLLNETLTERQVAGCVLMFIGMAVAQIQDIRALYKSKKQVTA